MNSSDTETVFLTGGTLLTLVVLSFLLERALALIFDHEWFRLIPNNNRYKPIIAFAAAWLVCWYYSFDVLAALLEPEGITWLGILITAGILSGGSAVVVQLVQQIWGFSRENREAKKELFRLKTEAERAEFQTRIAVAGKRIASVKKDSIVERS